jgi:hypothetical protein
VAADAEHICFKGVATRMFAVPIPLTADYDGVSTLLFSHVTELVTMSARSVLTV